MRTRWASLELNMPLSWNLMRATRPLCVLVTRMVPLWSTYSLPMIRLFTDELT